jgi:DegV family protein with EDD domain
MVIAIVTDSTADIPQDLTERYQIEVVPNVMVIDGESLLDGEGISREEFYRRLPEMNNPPTTATSSSGVYQNIYHRLFRQGATQILSIHASSLLSGIYNTASLAAQAFDQRVLVIDGEQITLGLGFQVLAAAEAVARGLGIEEIVAAILDVRRRVRVIAMLDTLEYVRRSGRVSWARARLGNLLRIKPFVELRGGRVFSLGEARTRRKGIERLREMLQELGPLDRLAVLHTNAEHDAQAFLASLENIPTRPFIVNVTTIIGTHVGPNGLGFAVVTRDPA